MIINPASCVAFLPYKNNLTYPESIVCAIGDGNYTHICLSDGRVETVSKTLSLVEVKCLSTPTFFRLHKQHIVNLQHIVGFENKKNEITLSNGNRLVVSRRRKKAFKTAFRLNKTK